MFFKRNRKRNERRLSKETRQVVPKCKFLRHTHTHKVRVCSGRVLAQVEPPPPPPPHQQQHRLRRRRPAAKLVARLALSLSRRLGRAGFARAAKVHEPREISPVGALDAPPDSNRPLARSLPPRQKVNRSKAAALNQLARKGTPPTCLPPQSVSTFRRQVQERRLLLAPRLARHATRRRQAAERGAEANVSPKVIGAPPKTWPAVGR